MGEGRIDPISLGKDFLIALKQFGEDGQLQGVSPLHLGLLNLRFHGQQEFFHRYGPRLLQLFFHKRQFAQVMKIAQRFGERVALITLQSIMHTCAVKAWGNANGIQTSAPSAWMSGVMGQPIVAHT